MIELNVKGIRIINDSEIQLGVVIPPNSSDLSKSIRNGFEELGWKATGSRFKSLDYETAVFTKKHYPIQESISVTCNGDCRGLVTSHNYPLTNQLEGRLVIPATVVSSKVTPLSCQITERSIECTIPSPKKSPDPISNIAPRYRYFSVKETDQFDGDIFIDDQVMVDKNDNITDYWAWIRYTSEPDGSGFKKSELGKLRKIISSIITDKM
ncbi:MAG: hypothetical protein ACTSRG_17515 [Candidatus Helarchaeota archaeon]